MITEKELAVRLGLSRPAMRAMRAAVLESGTHWTTREQDNAVMITDDGVAALESAIAEKNGAAPETALDMGATSDGFGGAALFDGAAKNGAIMITASVVQWRFKNARMIECTVTAPDELAGTKVMVRVRDNGKFREGMTVKALMDRPGFATLAGRGPRFAGRW